MKNLLIFILSITLLVGCSSAQNHLNLPSEKREDAGWKLNQKIWSIWNQEAKNDEIRKKADIYDDKEIYGLPRDNIVEPKKILNRIEQSKVQIEEYRKVVEQTQKKLYDLEPFIKEIADDKKRKDAEATLKKFHDLVKTELSIIDTVQAMNRLGEKYFTDATAKGISPNKYEEFYEKYANLIGDNQQEIDWLYTDFFSQLDECKEIWGKFHQDVTGKKHPLTENPKINNQKPEMTP